MWNGGMQGHLGRDWDGMLQVQIIKFRWKMVKSIHCYLPTLFLWSSTKTKKKTMVTEIYQTCQNNHEQLFSLTDLSHLFYQLLFWLLCGKLPVMNLCSVACEQALWVTGGALGLGENEINQAISICHNFLTIQYGDHGKQHVSIASLLLWIK